MTIPRYGIALLLAGTMLARPAPAERKAPVASGAQYAVATANPDATNAGMQVLASGGSAADAAVAIQMVLGVVEPQSSGLGGGAIALYLTAKDGRIRAFDGLAKSPTSYDASSAASPGFAHSGAAVGVPGSLRMLEAMHRRHGRLPWNTLFQRALELADTGFTVTPYLARSLAAASRAGMTLPSWLTDGAGHAATEGATVRNPELAETLRMVAKDGGDALYVASANVIVDATRHSTLPGRMSRDDITNYAVVEREPLCLPFKQNKVCSFPPPSYGGVTILEILGLLERHEARQPTFLDLGFIHRFIEAGRLAEADRMALVGDPDVIPVSVQELLNPAYLKARSALIWHERALADPVPSGTPPGISNPTCVSAEHAPEPSTSQISVVDASGNALAMTTTINVNFGAWLTVGGFFLNDAMTNFARPSDGDCQANAPAGGKRAATSMAPVMEMSPNRSVVVIGGSAGAGEIVDYVAQALIDLSAGRTPADALDDGHISSARASYPDTAGVVELERDRAVSQFAQSLRALGHKIRIVPLQSGTAFLVRRHNQWEGASDPRRDGTFASSH